MAKPIRTYKIPYDESKIKSLFLKASPYLKDLELKINIKDYYKIDPVFHKENEEKK